MKSESEIEGEMMEREQDNRFMQDCIKEAIHLHEQHCHKEQLDQEERDYIDETFG